jgi:uncharacterized damage-inducible protein DinB
MDLAYLISHWRSVRAALLETVDKLADAELDFQPYSGAWTVRALLLHIAQEERGEFAYGIMRGLPDFPSEYPVDAYPTVAAIQALLAEVHRPVVAFLDSLGDGDMRRTIDTPWGARYTLLAMLGHLIEHEIHHRGELSLILGMLGKKGIDA